MTDLALIWTADAMSADLALQGGQLVTDDGMRTAILISLFSDARAAEDAELPEDGADRRGWWGDTLAENAGPLAGTARDRNRIGSQLWLLARAKVTAAVVSRARQYCEEALEWIVRDGIASAVRVSVEARPSASRSALLAISVEIDRPAGPSRQRHDFTWDASTGDLTIDGDPA
ncbi:MAG: phage GP46 family protein [Sphingomonadales bacterium]|nr:phage GP46 family protein [Sphingomonadales bacterium]MBD3772131.1 phage GP46 family protein [Paracoccaceae bacterium]